MNKHYDTYLCRVVWRKMDARPLQCSASMLGLNDYQEVEQVKTENISGDLSAYFKQKHWEETEAFKFGQKKAP